MNTVSVDLSEKLWQDLVSLGDRERRSPDDLLQQAVRDFLQEKQAASQVRQALQESFGIWKDRDDMAGHDSTDIVDALREDWDERERRLASR